MGYKYDAYIYISLRSNVVVKRIHPDRFLLLLDPDQISSLRIVEKCSFNVPTSCFSTFVERREYIRGEEIFHRLVWVHVVVE